MSIGTMRCVAINVTDFAVGYEFWSAVTGYQILGPEHGWHGWLGFLGTTEPRKHEMILINTGAAPIQVEEPTHHQTNRFHIDITPNDGVDAAIERILELGGSVKKPPSLYPRPGPMRTMHRSSTGRSCRTRSATVLSGPRPHRGTVGGGHATLPAVERPPTTIFALPQAQTARPDNDTD